jgi:hypothetical protein
VPRYEQLYARGAYVGKEERERIQALLRPGRGGGGGRRGGGTRAMRRSAAAEEQAAATDPVTMPAPRPPREPAQGRLF